MSEEKQHWTVERKIPIAVIIALFIQMLAAVIWATELAARVETIEQHFLSSSVANERFARLEERLEYIHENVTIIRRKLDKTN
ncbi:MAG: hypothetical protein LW823_02325 [Rickettsiales bacterium]|jgi:hypothetical protein|nr:hypothetical protein [Rickettsiales bacterium]